MLMTAYCVFAYLVGVAVGRWYERRRKPSAVLVYGDSFAEDSPRGRRDRALRIISGGAK